MGEIIFIAFSDMVFTWFSGRTDSLTDGQTRIQYAPGTVFQRDGGSIKIH